MEMNIQQKLVLELLANNLRSASDATDKMRSRGATVFAASAGLLSFVSAGEMIGRGTEFQSACVTVSILAGIFVTFKGAGLFVPSETTTPGCASDAERLRDDYLDASEEDAIRQVISDRSSCFVDVQAANVAVSHSVVWMARGFVAQAICVAVTIAANILGK